MFVYLKKLLKKRFSKDRLYYQMVDQIFGFYPNNIELYKLALIHRSASFVSDSGQYINNERLEYLGDSILQAVVTDYLYIEFPDRNEGFLTQMRSKIVSRSTLNDLSVNIGLSEYVVKQSGVNGVGKNIYGDAMEAIIGAIYLDKGFDFVNRLVINNILKQNVDLILMTQTETDFKSRLIEWCQKNHRQIEFQTSLSKKSSSQTPAFYSQVLIDSLEVAYGEGSSKKEAQQMAAYNVSKVLSDSQSDYLLDLVDSNSKCEDEQSKN